MTPFMVTATRRILGIESTITKAVRADDTADAYLDFFNLLGCMPDSLNGWEIHISMVSERKWEYVFVCHNEDPD